MELAVYNISGKDTGKKVKLNKKTIRDTIWRINPIHRDAEGVNEAGMLQALRFYGIKYQSAEEAARPLEQVG